MAGKRGRPTDSRKEIRITVRIDARVAEALDAYSGGSDPAGHSSPLMRIRGGNARETIGDNPTEGDGNRHLLLV